jgi:hypothetical protein
VSRAVVMSGRGQRGGERNFWGEVALICGWVLAGWVGGGALSGQGLVIGVWWVNPGYPWWEVVGESLVRGARRRISIAGPA